MVCQHGPISFKHTYPIGIFDRVHIMSSTKDILLDYVSPAIGGVVACVMFTGM